MMSTQDVQPRSWSEWRIWAEELIESHNSGQVADTLADMAQQMADLREGFASEARIVQAQTLDLKGLAKCRRRILVEQVRRMARVALAQEPPRRSVRISGEDQASLVLRELEREEAA
jgi:hypothetical protein